jgi:hypothetical protein
MSSALLVPGDTAQRVKNYIVTGRATGNPPGSTLHLAWQRDPAIATFPENDSDGKYTLGYPFPKSVPIIYNGAIDACVKVQSLIKTGHSTNNHPLGPGGVHRGRAVEA